MKNKLVKKITGVLLSLAMAVVCLVPMSGIKAEAAEEAPQIVKYTNYCEYKQAGKTPRYSGETSGDFIFAGWFKDEACTSVVEDGAEEAYAKFVSADILSVACQVKSDTVENTATTALRMLSTVDSLKYNEVGFKVQVTGETEKSYSTQTVYKKVTALENGVEANEIEAKKFDSNSGWFFALTILNISKADYAKGIKITPYWKTLDGTVVTGISRYVRVEDYYLNYINVPIRINSTEDIDGIAAGRVTVTIPSGCSLVKPAEGSTLDLGIFEEMEYYVSGTSIIKLVGNVSDITENKIAEGLFVNLRLKNTSSQTVSEDTITVTYTKASDFCDIEEKIQTPLVRSAYKDFK